MRWIIANSSYTFLFSGGTPSFDAASRYRWPGFSSPVETTVDANNTEITKRLGTNIARMFSSLHYRLLIWDSVRSKRYR
jgi:hypothetical protein